MILSEFVDQNDVDFTYNRVDASYIPEMERLVGVRIGEQLASYITDYGYLGCRHIEFYGVNSIQMEKSDMIVRTASLHKRFPQTKDMIALEDRGDWDFILVDSNDKVYRFIPGNNTLSETNLKLNGYIIARFARI
ncbi:MAG: SMI1/KNR4 family protein [Clostridia bacterium]|nr:SMI1/KNR4 family protein [Clostridia bacterium]